MLETLITSKALRNLLSIFFLNPNNKYYIRELERLTGLAVNSVRRELTKLEKGNYLKSSNQARVKYYWVNKENPIYEELRSMLLKTQITKSNIFNSLKNITGLKYAFIYGSIVNNEDNADSDIDLMFLGSVDSIMLHEKISIIEKLLKRSINYTIENVNSIKKSKSSFIKRVISGDKVFIIGNENEFRRIIEEK